MAVNSSIQISMTMSSRRLEPNLPYQHPYWLVKRDNVGRGEEVRDKTSVAQNLLLQAVELQLAQAAWSSGLWPRHG